MVVEMRILTDKEIRKGKKHPNSCKVDTFLPFPFQIKCLTLKT